MKNMLVTALVPVVLVLALSACEPGQKDSAAVAPDLATSAEKTVDLAHGQATYNLFCSGCHNPGDGHAGTMKLKLLKGEENSVILARADLSADYIRYVVRDGLMEMAPFRPTDINDRDLDSLIAYIQSESSTANTAPNGSSPTPSEAD